MIGLVPVDARGDGEVTVLAHELIHRFVLEPGRGWPGANPEEGVAEWLTGWLLDRAGLPVEATRLRSALHDPVAPSATRSSPDPVPLGRALALERLPAAFLLPRSSRAPLYALLDARLTRSGIGADRLARTLASAWRRGGFVRLSDLARILPELRESALDSASR